MYACQALRMSGIYMYICAYIYIHMCVYIYVHMYIMSHHGLHGITAETETDIYVYIHICIYF